MSDGKLPRNNDTVESNAFDTAAARLAQQADLAASSSRRGTEDVTMAFAAASKSLLDAHCNALMQSDHIHRATIWRTGQR